MMIRNIWAVGRNYRDHAKEMQAEIPTEPLIFLKAGSCASVNSNEILLPWWTEEVHHEVELALKFNNAYQITEAAVALDLTERKLQAEAKKKGLPWTLSKSFSGACAVSAFFQMKTWQEFADLEIKLWVNEELRQQGSTKDLLFPCEKLVEAAMERFPVCPGDLLLTGTPAGVGPLLPGDRVKASIVGQITHQWTVRKESFPASKD